MLTSKVFIKILFISWLILVLAGLGLGLIESVSYRGIVTKYLGIVPVNIYLIAVILTFIINILKLKPVWLTNLKSKFKLFLLLFVPLSALLIYLEKAIYPNFIYSTLHIHPAVLNEVLIYLLMIWIFYPRKEIKKFSLSEIAIIFSNKILILILLSYIFLNNLAETTAIISKDFTFITKHANATYDEKMREKVTEEFYNYVQFVKNYTPDDATILIPPQNFPWPQTGNIPYMRYFLYPRKLTNSVSDLTDSGVDFKELDYVLLAWGESNGEVAGFTHGFPKFPVEAQEVIYLQIDGSVNIVPGNYKYEKDKNVSEWGVIKVKK